MNARRLALGCSLLLSLIGTSQRARACGPTVPLARRLEELLLPMGAAYRDGAIVARVVALDGVTMQEGPQSLTGFIDTGSGRIALKPGPWMSQEEQSLVPERELVAGSYLVEVSLGAPAPNATPTTLRLPFEVGPELAPALTVHGKLSVALADVERSTEVDCNTCGGGCRPGPSFRAQQAVVTLPAVTGGSTSVGYQAWVAFRADTPATFSGPGEPVDRGGPIDLVAFARTKVGESVQVEFVLPSEDRSYHPCFSVNFWDPAGHTAQTEALCLGASVSAISASTSDSEAAAPSERVAAGCSFGAGRASRTWVADLGLLALALVSRRRRGGRR